MGLLDQIGGMLNNGGGGGNPLERFMKGGPNLDDPHDRDHFGQMLGKTPPDQLSQVLGGAARNGDHDEYRQHITPGVGGTNPLGGLKGAAMTMVAGALMKHLTGGRAGGVGGGGGLSSLAGMIPGLSNTDPNRMNDHDVASVAAYARQHDPDAFGRAAAEVGHKDPSVLSALMGNQGMASVAKGLASHFLGGRQ